MCRKKAVWVLVYVASCGFFSSVSPRIGTASHQNPPIALPRDTSGGTMRTLCAGNLSKLCRQPRQKQSVPTGRHSSDSTTPSVGSPA